MPILLLKYWRYIAGYVLLAALAAGVLTYGHKRYVAGVAHTTALWQSDTAARDAATAKAIADARAKEDAARRTNEVIENDYQGKLAATAGERDNYYRMLREARGQVRGLAAAEATSATIAATAGEASIAERIDRAVAGVIVESRNNADQLDALIAVVKPQL